MFSSNTSQVSNDAVFVEDVFSTWLYTGNGSSQTINNGIELGAGYTGEVTLVGNGVAATGTATADSFIDVRTPIKVFDALVADGNYIWHSGSSGPHWWQYDFGAGNAKVVTRYRMMMRQSNDTYRATTWDFQGSNDGSTWTTLDSRSSQTFPSPTDNVPTTSQNDKFNTYFIASPASYRYYRFNNIASSSGSYVLIGELELIGGTSSSLVPTSGKGGLVWIKARSNADWNIFEDTARGVNQALSSNNTNAQATFANSVTSFNSNGFSLGSSGAVNDAAYSALVSWTFRKQPKFFDVVTYTGNGAANRYVNHSLASVPGCIILKRTDAASDWAVWHRVNGGSTTCTEFSLNQTGTPAPGFTATHTSTQFALDEVRNINNDFTNVNGATYVAYLFAHDAGGFGLTGTDNVISCGSFTTDASGNATVTLGYEPQWILIKNTQTAGFSWIMWDTMRGFANSSTAGSSKLLYPNLSNAEDNGQNTFPTATGFSLASQAASNTYIYIAIRRGPMKTPTSGTSVFAPIAQNNATGTKNTTGFPVDAQLGTYPSSGSVNRLFTDRLRGVSTNSTGAGRILAVNLTSNETSDPAETLGWDNTGYQTSSNYGSSSAIFWNFRRAPSFFDEVCYTGTGVDFQSVKHNLGVAPELVIVKSRSAASTNWLSFATQAPLGTDYNGLRLNTTGATAVAASAASFTSTTFLAFSNTALGLPSADNQTNSGTTYVAYLFASCPGVSKVGSYSGTGATQTISCGFAARFVMIKRTDDVGNWWVWDTARGMVSGTDPRLGLNLTTAQNNADWVYTDAAGFQIVTTDATVNASGGSYIFLAIS